jgi:DNA-binding response OmpR family regulator
MEWLQRMGELDGIPILVITGGDVEALKPRAMAAGAAGFFHKPFDNDELLAAIDQILGKQTMTADAAASQP